MEGEGGRETDLVTHFFGLLHIRYGELGILVLIVVRERAVYFENLSFVKVFLCHICNLPIFFSHETLSLMFSWTCV
jgi:hypothetical protein